MQLSLKEIKILLIISLTIVILACYLRAGSFSPISDERDIIRPAIEHLKGLPSSNVKYPPFAPLFYAQFLRPLLLLKLGNDNLLFIVAYIVNLCLAVSNLLLFFIIIRKHLSSNLALFTTFLLAFSPIFFYQAFFIKTESLLVFEILLMIFSYQRLKKNPNSYSWHIISSLLVVSAITTKYNIAIFSIYLVFIFKRRVFTKQTAVFLFFSVLGLLLIWRDIFHINDFISNILKNDLYFSDAPTMFKTVDEFWAFPYSRYSYPLLLTIPFAIGIINYPIAIISIASRSFNHLKSLGIFTLTCLVIIFHSVKLQVPYLFTPIVPYAIFLVGLFLKKIKNKYYLMPVITILAVSSFLQFSTFTTSRLNFSSTLKQLVGTYGKNAIFLISSVVTTKQGFNAHTPMDLVNKKNHRYIILLDSYIKNFCKYKEDSKYKKQCDLFWKTVNNPQKYRLLENREIKYPLKWLNPDPEKTLTFYVFEKLEKN